MDFCTQTSLVLALMAFGVFSLKRLADKNPVAKDVGYSIFSQWMKGR